MQQNPSNATNVIDLGAHRKKTTIQQPSNDALKEYLRILNYNQLINELKVAKEEFELEQNLLNAKQSFENSAIIKEAVTRLEEHSPEKANFIIQSWNESIQRLSKLWKS